MVMLVILLLVSLVAYGFGINFILKFTPVLFALIFSAIFIFWEEYPKTKLAIAGIIIFACYLLELIGVQTGLLFGSYTYGDYLGFKVLGTPLIIGLLWFIVTISAWQIVLLAGKLRLFEQLALGTTIIIFFDLLLEQFAISLGFWWWNNGSVPIYNYICWAGISMATFLLYKFYAKKTQPSLFVVSILPILSIWLWLMLAISEF
jgi:putative membrane protein